MKFKLVEAIWKSESAANRHYLKHCAGLMVLDRETPDKAEYLIPDLGYPQVQKWCDEYKKRAEDLSNADSEPLLSLDDCKENVVYGFIQRYEGSEGAVKFRKRPDGMVELVIYIRDSIQSYYSARWGRIKNLFGNKLKGLNGELPENREKAQELIAKKKAEQEEAEKAKQEADEKAAEKESEKSEATATSND